MAKIKKTPMLLSWDESDIGDAEVKYRLENQGDGADDGDDQEEAKTEEQIRDEVFADSDLFSVEWDDLCDNLTELMEKRNPDGRWYASMHNFGWRGDSGDKYFRDDNGKDFLDKILPKTDCTFHIFNDGSGFKIQNFHHDSPVGKEWYYIRPVSEHEWEEKVGIYS